MMEACAAGIGLCQLPGECGERSSLDGARDTTKIPVWGGEVTSKTAMVQTGNIH